MLMVLQIVMQVSAKGVWVQRREVPPRNALEARLPEEASAVRPACSFA